MRIGELFSGYGGLGLGVQMAIGGEVVWHSEIDKACNKILNHHWPDIPNLGDITKIDWATVPPVDVLTGGTPCQDLSQAGKRGGLYGGNRSNLWVSMREAIAVLRPGLIVWENVKGALYAEADSDLEYCSGCMGGGSIVPMRALQRVLGDIADLGYDAEWLMLRAADIGAPHNRARVWLTAHPRGKARGLGAGLGTGQSGKVGGAGPNNGGVSEPITDPGRVRYGGGPHGRGLGRLDRPNQDQSRQRQRARQKPRDRNVETNWGIYAPAIARWETVTGRDAPAPTRDGGRGGTRLNPVFVEWLMGLPEGHVTNPAIGIKREHQLKALGNGVVPLQAAEAIGRLTKLAGVAA